MVHLGALDIRQVPGASGLPNFQYYYHVVRMHALAVNADDMDFVSTLEDGQQVLGHLAFDKVDKVFARIARAPAGNDVVHLRLQDRDGRVLFEGQLECVHSRGADVVSAILTLCKNCE